jgi:hypothetical protein
LEHIFIRISSDAVIEEYKKDSEEGKRAALSKDILEYIDKYPDDTELGLKLFEELGCYYNPQTDGISPREWLKGVAKHLV